MSSRGFVTYMGIGNCDLRIDLRQSDHLAEDAARIAREMEQDASILRHTSLITKAFQVETPDGTVRNLLTELGDHRVFPVSYVKGQAPVSPDEIALSAMNAEELGRSLGDSLTLITGSGTQMCIRDRSVFLSFVRKAHDRIAIFFIAIFNSLYKSADRRHGLPPLSS